MSPSLAGQRAPPPQILRVLSRIAAELAPLIEQQAAAELDAFLPPILDQVCLGEL